MIRREGSPVAGVINALLLTGYAITVIVFVVLVGALVWMPFDAILGGAR